MENEDTETYVARLKDELDNEFQRLGPETVCAVFLEPMVGTVGDHKPELGLVD